MKKGLVSFRAWPTRLGLVIALLFSGAAWAQEAMLHYQIRHALLATPDHFSVSVFDDGVALVHFPEYMEKSGDYAVQLSPSEVQQMRQLLQHPMVQNFDAGQMRREQRLLDEQTGELFAISDDSISSFELGASVPGKSIRWANLEIEARRYPGIGVLRKLADFEAELRRLDEHPNAIRLED